MSGSSSPSNLLMRSAVAAVCSAKSAKSGAPPDQTGTRPAIGMTRSLGFGRAPPREGPFSGLLG
jgi:hypothetical protein